MVTKRPDQPTLKTASGDKIDEAEEKILILDYGVEIANYIEDQKEARIKERNWKENSLKLWNLILSHCPKQVTLKLEAQPEYEEHTLKRDPIQLLELLRDIAQSFNVTKNESMAIVESDVKLYLGFQGKTASFLVPGGGPACLRAP